MKIGFDAKRYFHNSSGLGNYSRSLIEGLSTFAPEIEVKLYDIKGFERSLHMGRKAAGDACCIFHGLSNELPLDIKASGVKSIVTVHDTCWRRYPSMYHTPDILIHDIKCRLAIKNADHVIAISESTKKDIISIYGTDPSKISVIYQSVADLWLSPLDKREARERITRLFPQIAPQFILSIGSINRRKNLINVLRALSGIDADNRPQLVVCGKGDKSYTNECKAYAGGHLRPSDVIWLHGIDTDTLKSLCASAMAVLYPSNYEGFGLPIVEALMQKTPVITSNVSSMPEAAGPGALLVDPSNIEEISAAISRMIQSDDLRSELSEKGYSYCLTAFDKKQSILQYTTLYKSLL